MAEHKYIANVECAVVVHKVTGGSLYAHNLVVEVAE